MENSPRKFRDILCHCFGDIDSQRNQFTTRRTTLKQRGQNVVLWHITYETQQMDKNELTQNSWTIFKLQLNL